MLERLAEGTVKSIPSFDLSTGKDYGAVHLKCAHMASAGQPGYQAQPARVRERQVLPDQSDLLL